MLGDPAVAKIIGIPTYDRNHSLILAGSDQGTVYAVTAPF
jgi:hypothetical protein